MTPEIWCAMDKVSHYFAGLMRGEHFGTMGVLKKHDWKIPMSSVHWILGLNRADKLGKNVGININWALKTTLMGNRMGLPIDSVNAFRMSLSRILGNENRFLPVDQKQTVNNFRVLSCSKIYLN